MTDRQMDSRPQHKWSVLTSMFCILFWVVWVFGHNPLTPNTAVGVALKIIFGVGAIGGMAIWIMMIREILHDHRKVSE